VEGGGHGQCPGHVRLEPGVHAGVGSDGEAGIGECLVMAVRRIGGYRQAAAIAYSVLG
jgi:hypothetical protein